MGLDDHYRRLGIKSDANRREIKKTYREKALETHPDKRQADQKEAEEEFKKGHESYEEILKSKEEDHKIHTKRDYSSDISPIRNQFHDHYQDFFTHVLKKFSEMVDESPNTHVIKNRKTISINSCDNGHSPYTLCLKCRKKLF